MLMKVPPAAVAWGRDHAPARPIRFETYDSFEALEPLRQAWDELAGRSREYYSARSYAVCKASWENVARPRGRQLRCIAGFRGDKLALIWPFVLYRRAPGMVVAQPLGPEATEYTTALVDDAPDAEKIVADALEIVSRTSGCNVMRLELVRPESVVARAIASSKMMKVSEPMYVSSTVWDGIPDWDTYASRWNAKQRRRRRRKLDEAGKVSIEIVTHGPEAEEAIDWVLATKLRWMAWRGEQNVWIGTPEFRNYLLALARDRERTDGLVIFLLKLEGRIVAADMCFADRFRVEGWVTTYDTAFADLGVGRILMEQSMRWAFDRRLEFDQRLSWAEYKLHWTNTEGFVHSHWCTHSPWVSAFFSGRLWAKRQRDALRNRWEKLRAKRLKPPAKADGSHAPT